MRKLLRRAVSLLAVLALALGVLVGLQLPADAASCKSKTYRSTLVRAGSNGPAAKAVQCLLRKVGYRVRVDGSLSARDVSNIKSFQRKNGIRSTGNVGPLTWPVLIQAAKKVKRKLPLERSQPGMPSCERNADRGPIRRYRFLGSVSHGHRLLSAQRYDGPHATRRRGHLRRDGGQGGRLGRQVRGDPAFRWHQLPVRPSVRLLGLVRTAGVGLCRHRSSGTDRPGIRAALALRDLPGRGDSRRRVPGGQPPALAGPPRSARLRAAWACAIGDGTRAALAELDRQAGPGGRRAFELVELRGFDPVTFSLRRRLGGLTERVAPLVERAVHANLDQRFKLGVHRGCTPRRCIPPNGTATVPSPVMDAVVRAGRR